MPSKRRLDGARLKSNLKLTSERIKLLSKKKINLCEKAMRLVADMLKEEKDEEAMLECENLLREIDTVEAYEMLDVYCQHMLSRLQALTLSAEPPMDLMEAIATLLWTSCTHEDLKELVKVRIVLGAYYGKEVISQILDAGDYVNSDVQQALTHRVVERERVIAKLRGIAKKYNVEWDEANIDAKDFGIGLEVTGSMSGPGARIPDKVAVLPPDDVPGAVTVSGGGSTWVQLEETTSSGEDDKDVHFEPVQDDIPPLPEFSVVFPDAPDDMDEDDSKKGGGGVGGGGGGSAKPIVTAAAPPVSPVQMTLDSGGAPKDNDGNDADDVLFPSIPSTIGHDAPPPVASADDELDDLQRRLAALRG